MVVSVTISPSELTPKSSSLTITPGKPSMKMRKPCSGAMSKMMRQRSPFDVARPVVVRHHDLMIFGPAPVATNALQFPRAVMFGAFATFSAR